jgi:hypothetical protein
MVCLSLVLAVPGFVFGFVRPTLSGTKPAASLTVLVYNYAEVSPATLASAEREAFKILGDAGVRVGSGFPKLGPQAGSAAMHLGTKTNSCQIS